MSEYTISELAKLSNVTTRTLRYYDQIDLLNPNYQNASGFRIYTQVEVNKLQEILFYREMNINLSEIKLLLENDEPTRLLILQKHCQSLIDERKHMDNMIQTIQKTIKTYKGEEKMTNTERFEHLKATAIKQNEELYGEKMREDYDADMIKKSNQKFLSMNEAQYQSFKKLEEDIKDLLIQATKNNDPSSPDAITLVKNHEQWIRMTWHSFSSEAYLGLADLYIDSPDFKAYYDKIVPNGAQFLHDAIHATYK